ncbi:MAG: hypothetical protein QF473_09355 [Planctomycetota bacterium]|jgi:hypothetical protein|nr:hypothetical protein [Planctomycetota bacterium]
MKKERRIWKAKNERQKNEEREKMAESFQAGSSLHSLWAEMPAPEPKLLT